MCEQEQNLVLTSVEQVSKKRKREERTSRHNQSPCNDDHDKFGTTLSNMLAVVRDGGVSIKDYIEAYVCGPCAARQTKNARVPTESKVDRCYNVDSQVDLGPEMELLEADLYSWLHSVDLQQWLQSLEAFGIKCAAPHKDSLHHTIDIPIDADLELWDECELSTAMTMPSPSSREKNNDSDTHHSLTQMMVAIGHGVKTCTAY